MINVAINGFGRIGRNILRALYERPEVASRLRVAAINDLGTPEINAHLLQFDTTHGRFGATVTVEDGALNVNGDRIAVFAERKPEDLPWSDLNIDVVFECIDHTTDGLHPGPKAHKKYASELKKILKEKYESKR